MLEATLNEEIAKAIDHERVSLSNDGLDDIELLISGADLKLLFLLVRFEGRGKRDGLC